MSPIGHTITSFSMAATFMHVNGVRWGEGFSRLPAIMLHQDVSQMDKSAIVTLISMGILLGARGPDRLELPVWDRRKNVRRSLIPHRTLTHWPPLWLLIVWFFGGLREIASDILIYEISCVGFGFGLSGLLHLCMDVMTPMGIPLLKPFGQRTSLTVYKSSQVSEWCFIFFLVVSSQFLSRHIAL